MSAAIALKQAMEAELRENILPFWLEYAVDWDNGGFYGEVTSQRTPVRDAPKSVVLNARILWTYAAAYRRFQEPRYLEATQRAYDYLYQYAWDHQYGGFYWMLDHRGNPFLDRKHSAAQAYALYGLAEYYRATEEPPALQLAQQLFQLLKLNSYDTRRQGYLEGCDRRWQPLMDARLSADEPARGKSMDTTLHLMEAYTCLLRVWPSAQLQTRLRELVSLMLDKVFDPAGRHLQPFFELDWRPIPAHISYGHDLEASWLLTEAVALCNDTALLARAQEVAVALAQAVYAEGLDSDGAVVLAGGPQGVTRYEKYWWPQAEGVVGFFNAYQLSGAAHFRDAALRCWEFIAAKLIDREYGEWHRIIERDGTPRPGLNKVGPWECPYHNARACLEIIARVEARGE